MTRNAFPSGQRSLVVKIERKPKWGERFLWKLDGYKLFLFGFDRCPPSTT